MAGILIVQAIHTGTGLFALIVLSALSSLSRACPNHCNEAESGPASALSKDAINGARNSTRSHEATVVGDDRKRPEQLLRLRRRFLIHRAEHARSRSTREGPAG